MDGSGAQEDCKMTDSFAQAMVFFLVVLFGLGLTFPGVAYYK